jgi:hypothetical protein
MINVKGIRASINFIYSLYNWEISPHLSIVFSEESLRLYIALNDLFGKLRFLSTQIKQFFQYNKNEKKKLNLNIFNL